MKPSRKSFLQLLSEAIRDFSVHGYDRFILLKWQGILRDKILSEIPTEAQMQGRLRTMLSALYRRKVENGQILKHHPGISRITLSSLSPSLRPELDRRIMASVDLIRLNRSQAIEKTLSRFAGWSTSIPRGGSKAVEAQEVKNHIAKPLKSLSFEERRLYIDQGHKMVSNISSVLAAQSGAIAFMWRSHWRQAGYDYRPDHKERDGKIYAIRGNWAMNKGLMNRGDGFSDEITAPAEEPFCRCYAVFLYALRDLPDDMLTEKGKKLLSETRVG